MAHKQTILWVSLLTSSLACAFVMAQATGQNAEARYQKTLREEVIVTGERWRKPNPKPDVTPDWRLPKETQQKLQSRMELGYDPILAQMRANKNNFKLYDNGREQKPAEVFRLKF